MHQVHLRLLTASPAANGFYGAKGVSGMILSTPRNCRLKGRMISGPRHTHAMHVNCLKQLRSCSQARLWVRHDTHRVLTAGATHLAPPAARMGPRRRRERCNPQPTRVQPRRLGVPRQGHLVRSPDDLHVIASIYCEALQAVADTVMLRGSCFTCLHDVRISNTRTAREKDNLPHRSGIESQAA